MNNRLHCWVLLILSVAACDPLSAQQDAVPYDAFGDEEIVDKDAILRSAVRPSPFRRGIALQGASTAEMALEKDNCLFGAPRAEQGSDLGQIDMVYRKGYVLAHSRLYKIPLWVCEHSTAAEIVGSADRKLSSFQPDPKLHVGSRAELSDYKKSGFDRGHQAPAGDFKIDQSLMDDSFFLSNMVPQFGPTFNRGIWANLEDTVRKWVAKRGECWIITGPMFYDPLEEDESTADGWVEYQTIGANEVAVPTHLFKIVVAKNSDGYEAVTFVMSNKHYGQPYRLKGYIATIDWVEARTGLDFLPELTDSATLGPMGLKLESTKSEMWESN